MDIAMISYYLPSGSKIGVGYQVHALANETVRRGHRVTVFSGCGPSAGAVYRTAHIELTGSNRIFKFAQALRRIDWTRFDVLHAHGDDYWLADRTRPFHVRTMHGSCFAEMRRIHGARERLRMSLLGLGELRSITVADVTVPVSAGTYPWIPRLAAPIPNGVDLSRFKPGPKSPQPTILFVGTYGNRKRGRLLVEAFQETVRPALPEAELWMVCEDAPASPGVHVLGRVSDAELARRYASAWLFCLPSSYEGFGIPYIEAMASGTPVVATPNPGALEVTEHGSLGSVVAASRLGGELLALLRTERRRTELASRALAAVRRYDIASVAERYERLYAQRWTVG